MDKTIKDEERKVIDFCVSRESGLNNPDSLISSPATQASLFQVPFVVFSSSFREISNEYEVEDLLPNYDSGESSEQAHAALPREK